MTNQEDWLKAHLAGFSSTQVNKTTSKEFFPIVLKEWRKARPTPDTCWENGHGDGIKLLASGRMNGVGYNLMMISTTFSTT